MHIQVVDIDNREDTIRIFGRDTKGQSACVSVRNFMFYFYCEANPSHSTQSIFAKWNCICPGAIYSIEEETKQSVMYATSTTKTFWKVTLSHVGEKDKVRQQLLHTVATYEFGLSFVQRFMIDYKIRGSCWISFPIEEPDSYTGCVRNYTVSCSQMEAHKPDDVDWQHIAPLRVLSFDIECAGRTGIFPQPETDPVIMISSAILDHGLSTSEAPCVKALFVLFNEQSGESAILPIEGVQIHTFACEKDLLLAWAQFVRDTDPDIITGYNILSFDLPYLSTRSKIFEADTAFNTLGRVAFQQMEIREVQKQSNQAGARQTNDIFIPGRVVLDMYKVLLESNEKLRSYSLNAVSLHYLNDIKEDVPHKMISVLYRAGPAERRRLGLYCIKDSILALRLLENRLVIPNYVEMSRVTGVLIVPLLTRGQQFKVQTQILHETKSKGYLLPDRNNNNQNKKKRSFDQQQETGDVSYEGAYVIEPKRGFYDVPIATLDFNSLYPSIMIAHNLCYTTFIPANQNYFGEYTTSPDGDRFASDKPGLLPEILRNLLDARKRARAQQKTVAKNSSLYAVLEGRQLALKVSANSVYGAMGASRGLLPELQNIARSVTAFGRVMIQTVKEYVETHFFGTVVIYGDTDSVMIKFGGVKTVQEAITMGTDAATQVTTLFKKPINMEFEKVNLFFYFSFPLSFTSHLIPI